MKKWLLLVTIFLILVDLDYSQTQPIENFLFNLPDVIFKKIDTPDSFNIAYELKIRQPLDHFDLSKGYFQQKVYLSHKSFDRPTVLNTEGYAAKQNDILEITEFLNANQITVEHRFFGESKPDSIDYQYLNLKQVTADLHQINQMFKKIYDGKWVSSGISKGGVTTIFYRYFYPDDFDVAVPYVSPVNKEFEDKRIYAFLDTVGTDACRQKIKSLQIRLLKNREVVLPLIKFFSKGKERNYSYLTLEKAFEYAVLEYPFYFWQWSGNCSEIPGDEVPLEEAVDYFVDADPMSCFTDSEIEYNAPHYYQSASEMGYYGYETGKFKDLIKTLPTDANVHATVLPKNIYVYFDDTLLAKVNKWLETEESDKFIYIYGGQDTWSANAVVPSEKIDSRWFFLKGKNHGQARISGMNSEEKQLLINTLEEWLLIEID